jgi:hypothetical protein
VLFHDNGTIVLLYTNQPPWRGQPSANIDVKPIVCYMVPVHGVVVLELTLSSNVSQMAYSSNWGRHFVRGKTVVERSACLSPPLSRDLRRSSSLRRACTLPMWTRIIQRGSIVRAR